MVGICASCKNALVITLDDQDDPDFNSLGGSASSPQPQQLPDDVGLTCGCHFHWECLLEAYSLTSCPSCSADIATISASGQQQVLCTLHNEGGIQHDLDILPILSEEGYLKAYPEERKCRAFLEFCREGDLMAIVGLLQDESDDENEAEQGSDVDVLRYQDGIGEMQSGLHAAISGGSREVVWLLLWLASGLDSSLFPSQVLQEANAMGLERTFISSGIDVRSLKDALDRTPEQLARELGGWEDWLGTGRLSI